MTSLIHVAPSHTLPRQLSKDTGLDQ